MDLMTVYNAISKELADEAVLDRMALDMYEVWRQETSTGLVQGPWADLDDRARTEWKIIAMVGTKAVFNMVEDVIFKMMKEGGNDNA